jgi:hypothetical protein
MYIFYQKVKNKFRKYFLEYHFLNRFNLKEVVK